MKIGAAWYGLLPYRLPTISFCAVAGPLLEWFAPGGPTLQFNGIINAELRMPILP
ncbi:hypothetical protein OPU71_11615 [Niveibacterium sp. 24ML]|uniref:hypothetical protein n=1 Tax=Niveibacterium sp. 24ML TaxID=2985512 RepID=UPI00226E2CCD|nr:hypothetical protein [Niveibacterium sp. 24ML]MCX9156773.1 hypothetical protein [Niveibacterium sp. 24ML]